MSTATVIIDDPVLGRLARAETTLDDGDTVVHDWYAGSIEIADRDVELMIDGADTDAVQALLPRLRTGGAEIDRSRRRASDAILTHFSDSEPSRAELDDGATDLLLDVIETTADVTVLHFTDACGQHFPEGYWPAAHLDLDGNVVEVTIES